MSVFLVDVQSPLTQYVRLLKEGPQALHNRLSRDAKAVKLLTDPSEFRVQRPRQTVPGVCTPRVWTRRDQRYVDRRAGKSAGPDPKRRTGRYLDRVSPANGLLFRAALNEARSDGTADELAPILVKARNAFHELLFAAQCASISGDPKDAGFFAARQVLPAIANELVFWTKEPSARHGPGLQQTEVTSGTDSPVEPGISGEASSGVSRVVDPEKEDDTFMLSSTDVLHRVPGASADAIRAKLSRFRNSDRAAVGWREVSDRRPNEPKYLYKWKSVRHLFNI